ncbi:MAG: DUF4450 domain-containing protein [Bacteroidota bacterium]
MKMKLVIGLSILYFMSFSIVGNSQPAGNLWHGIERTLRYHPEGTDFVIENGNRRFTRALYGTNTAFRVEAGDLPEFALYMPGMGGTIKLGISASATSKWLINADKITARYRPGSMLYDIEDKLLGNGKLHLAVLAMADAEGVIIKLDLENVSPGINVVWAYGGASGKKFFRDGDMGPDPESSFYLKPEYCSDNNYTLSGNSFLLKYGTGMLAEWDPYVNRNLASDTVKPAKIGKEQKISGFVPPAMKLKVADAGKQETPEALYQSSQSASPLITGRLEIQNNEAYFFSIRKFDSIKTYSYADAGALFNKAETARKEIAGRIKLVTPDPFINTLGAVLGTTEDAIWESPTYLHGSIGWRMRLNGWRGPYVGDVLGLHDRARMHFKSYSLSQVTTPEHGPVVMDTALHLARTLEKMGTALFTSGYISRNPNGDLRPHHYDMNLVYIDALLRHFYWTGDKAFAKEMWPVITRHLAWEKRNFDSDDDGLYDAYAAIWASDALQYSGGSVTHSSAYNYKANKEAAVIAKWIGEDATPYEKEAATILKAINSTLWMPLKGTYAEYKDLLGNKLLHSNPAIWTLYHSLDSDVPDAFQAYQSMRYIDKNIPHIPVKAKGLEDGYYTLSTSKWMPYDWSLNNVATAEVMHTALANWQAGRNEKGYHLFKSELLATMYLGGSPGNIGQISFYDAARGEAYRDFADPVAMVSRSLVEGLFGILPDAIGGELLIKPGFPAAWNNASLETPDIAFDFKRKQQVDIYHIVPKWQQPMQLRMLLKVNGSSLKSIQVNGKPQKWKNIETVIGIPVIELLIPSAKDYTIKIIWAGQKTFIPENNITIAGGDKFIARFPNAVIKTVYDPQQSLKISKKNGNTLYATVNKQEGNKTLFVKTTQGIFTSWQPVYLEIKSPVEIIASYHQPRGALVFFVRNNTKTSIDAKLVVNPNGNPFDVALSIPPVSGSKKIIIPADRLIAGSNKVVVSYSALPNNKIIQQGIINWAIENKSNTAYDIVDVKPFFNDKVTQIFKNQYLSPRPTVPTLQLPTQGIGDWTHPLKTAAIDDRGLRMLAAGKESVTLPQGIPFATPYDSLQSNILFTSQWDNYPCHAIVPLSGKASHAYLLMAGSTNPMQSRIVNGYVIISYTDNSADTLLLKNPETWWPIEQDYMDDGFAFTIDAARPVRIHLKTGKIVSDYDNSISAFAGKAIDGGAATVLDIALDKNKTLKQLKLETVANDVVIGLMALTLVR